MKCKEIESLLLDYVYGLVEGDEMQGVEKHLAQCTNCQNALNWAKGKKTLIKEAIVEPWNQVRFDSKTLQIQDPHQNKKQTSKIQYGVWAALAALVLIQVVPVWLYFSDSNSNEVALVRSIEDEFDGFQRNPKDIPPPIGPSGPESTNLVTVLRLEKLSGPSGDLFKYRSFTLNQSDASPVKQPLDLHFILVGPDGEKEIAKSNGQAVNRSGKPLLNSSKQPITGFAQGSFKLPKTHAPETWSLEVREGGGQFAPVRQPIETRKISKKDLAQEVQFDKDSYLPGDNAVATIILKDGKGNPIPNQKVILGLFFGGKPHQIDGIPSLRARIERLTSTDGKAKLEFAIPKDFGSGKNELTSQVPSDSGQTSETFPIPVQK